MCSGEEVLIKEMARCIVSISAHRVILKGASDHLSAKCHLPTNIHWSVVMFSFPSFVGNHNQTTEHDKLR